MINHAWTMIDKVERYMIASSMLNLILGISGNWTAGIYPYQNETDEAIS